jgi:hypothetical protein
MKYATPPLCSSEAPASIAPSRAEVRRCPSSRRHREFVPLDGLLLLQALVGNNSTKLFSFGSATNQPATSQFSNVAITKSR